MLLTYCATTIISIFLLMNILINYHIDSEIKNELNIHSEVVFNIEKRLEEQDRICESVSNGINRQPKIAEEIKILTTSKYEDYISNKLDKFNISNIKQIDLKYLVDTMLGNRDDALAVVVNDKNKEFKSEFVLNHDKWYDIKNKKGEGKYIRKITKKVNNVDTIYTIGYIDIYFDLSQLNTIVNKSNLKGSIIIIDEYDNVIFDNDKILTQKDVKEIKNNNYDFLYDLNTYIDNKNTLYPIIQVHEDAQTNFRYISLIQEKDLGISKTKNYGILIAIISIFAILLTTYVRINRYSIKLKGIILGIDKIKNGDLNIQFNIQKEEDELDMIARNIDDMSNSLQESINKNYICEVKQKQAEISALQSQINPHFLYNTLEVIRMCALSSKNTEVANMIYNLGNMFKYSTYNNASMVSLKDELKYAKTYLDLCKSRYKGIMSYNIDVNEEYLDCLVPKFIIQPIVENSINHGIKKSLKDNFISIKLIKENDYIKIIVKDNGYGITKERMDEISKDLQNNLQKKKSIGLMNIDNRLKLSFGEDFGLNIESESEKGTIVTIKLPIIRGEVEYV